MRHGGTIAAALGLAALGALAFVSPGTASAAGTPTHPDVSYDIDSPPSIAAENQLDVYAPPGGGSARPVAVFAHGGAWRAGDKNNNTIANKARVFNDAGYVFVSVNYRLSPDPPETSNPNRVMFPDHPHDVGEAIAWLSRNVAGYGGDPKRIVLLGHSAGAHLVSLVATDPTYVDAYDVKQRRILGVVSLDTAAFDATDLDPATSTRPPGDLEVGWNAFGTPTENAATGSWEAASPITHADPDDPPFLLVTQTGNPGDAGRQAENRAMAQALGQDPDNVLLVDLTHGEINAALGDPNDATGETQAVMGFANAVTRVPKVQIKKHPAKRVRGSRNRTRVRFRFEANFPEASFECRLDSRRYKPCDSPKSYRLKARRHRFKVRALNGALKGTTDAFRFRVAASS